MRKGASTWRTCQRITRRKLLLGCTLAGAAIEIVCVPFTRFATIGCGARETRRTWRTTSGGMTERSTTDSWPRRELPGPGGATSKLPVELRIGSAWSLPEISLLGQLSVVLLSVIPPDMVLQVRRVCCAPHPLVANRERGTGTIAMSAPASLHLSKSFNVLSTGKSARSKRSSPSSSLPCCSAGSCFSSSSLSPRLLRLPPPRDQWDQLGY